MSSSKQGSCGMVHRGTNPKTEQSHPANNALVLFLMAIAYLGQCPLPAFGETNPGEEWITITIGAHKQAQVKLETTFPAPPLLVFDVLTDYPHWPNLFPTPPHIDHIKKEEGRVIVDMAIPMSFLPMQLRLVTATQETRPSQVETKLVRGDFDRYDWTWKLVPATLLDRRRLFSPSMSNPKSGFRAGCFGGSLSPIYKSMWTYFGRP